MTQPSIATKEGSTSERVHTALSKTRDYLMGCERSRRPSTSLAYDVPLTERGEPSYQG